MISIDQLTDPSTLVLTANNRLRQTLTEQVNQCRQGTWLAPNIMTYTQYVSSLMQASLDWHGSNTVLLSPQQAMHLWRQCMPTSNAFSHHHALIQTSYQAWQSCQQWLIKLDQLANSHYDNTEIFYEWQQNYLTKLTQNHWLDPHQIPSLLAKQLEQAPPRQNFKTVITVGLQHAPPSTKYFLESLANHTQIKQSQPPKARYQPKTILFERNDEELVTMARWAYQQPQSHTIACVVPQLHQSHQTIRNVFDQVRLSLGREAPDISVSQSLAETPAIQLALALIDPPDSKMPLDTISQWLTSPFLLPDIEMPERCQLDLRLREQLTSPLPLETIIGHGKALCPVWTKAFQQFTQCLEAHPDTTTTHQVCDLMQQCLSLWQWPGKAINTDQAKRIERWWQLVQTTFRSLHLVQPTMTLKQAHQRLIMLSQTEPYQPAAAPTNIHILGVLEACDIAFDAVWIADVNDQQWPPTPSPNPFIPLELQTKHQMPGATAEQAFYKSLTQQLCQQPAIFSSCQVKDDIECLPSSLLRNESPNTQAMPITVEALQLPPWQSPEAIIAAAGQYDSFSDDKAPQLEAFKGGSSILEHQAQCPFKAFASQRLKLSALAKPSNGLTPQLRGTLIHECLAMIWQKLETQDKLLSLQRQDQEQLNQLVADTVAAALNKHGHALALTKTRRMLEAKRLTHHMHQWLEVEQNRPPFKVIAIEQQQEYTIDKLTLRTRIDRADELEDGSTLLIDYKTGQVQRQHWLQTPLLSPQLPLYYQSYPKTGAIAFAQIKARQWQWSGIAKHDIDIKGITPMKKLKLPTNNTPEETLETHDEPTTSWQTLTQHWQQELTRLANSFCHGDAQVAPASPECCQRCDFQSLCRVELVT